MKFSKKIWDDVVSFCLLNRPQGLPQFKYGRICALTKLWFSTVAIIELPYEPKRKNVHPPMMWLCTAHCSLMSSCPHFYNLFTLLQLFHTSTLHLAQLLVTKTIGSETMGNSQLDPLNTDYKQLLLELSCILGEHSTSFQYQKSCLDLASCQQKATAKWKHWDDDAVSSGSYK